MKAYILPATKIILKLILSILITYFYSKDISTNKDVLNIIVSLFSIFSGFLFLIIPMLGSLYEPSIKDNRNQIAINHRYFTKITNDSLSLFIAYLIDVILILIFSMNHEGINIFLEKNITFLSVYLLITSFSLPFFLKKSMLQMHTKKLGELSNYN